MTADQAANAKKTEADASKETEKEETKKTEPKKPEASKAKAPEAAAKRGLIRELIHDANQQIFGEIVSAKKVKKGKPTDPDLYEVVIKQKASKAELQDTVIVTDGRVPNPKEEWCFSEEDGNPDNEPQARRMLPN